VDQNPNDSFVPDSKRPAPAQHGEVKPPQPLLDRLARLELEVEYAKKRAEDDIRRLNERVEDDMQRLDEREEGDIRQLKEQLRDTEERRRDTEERRKEGNSMRRWSVAMLATLMLSIAALLTSAVFFGWHYGVSLRAEAEGYTDDQRDKLEERLNERLNRIDGQLLGEEQRDHIQTVGLRLTDEHLRYLEDVTNVSDIAVHEAFAAASRDVLGTIEHVVFSGPRASLSNQHMRRLNDSIDRLGNLLRLRDDAEREALERDFGFSEQDTESFLLAARFIEAKNFAAAESILRGLAGRPALLALFVAGDAPASAVLEQSDSYTVERRRFDVAVFTLLGTVLVAQAASDDIPSEAKPFFVAAQRLLDREVWTGAPFNGIAVCEMDEAKQAVREHPGDRLAWANALKNSKVAWELFKYQSLINPSPQSKHREVVNQAWVNAERLAWIIDLDGMTPAWMAARLGYVDPAEMLDAFDIHLNLCDRLTAKPSSTLWQVGQHWSLIGELLHEYPGVRRYQQTELGRPIDQFYAVDRAADTLIEAIDEGYLDYRPTVEDAIAFLFDSRANAYVVEIHGERLEQHVRDRFASSSETKR
jgi:hypothetical protein